MSNINRTLKNIIYILLLIKLSEGFSFFNYQSPPVPIELLQQGAAESRILISEEIDAVLNITSITSLSPCEIEVQWEVTDTFHSEYFEISWIANNTNGSELNDQVSGETFNYTITELVASTTYLIMVDAISMNSNASETGDGETLEGDPPAIDSLTAYDVTSTKIHLNWTNELPQCPFAGYKIDWISTVLWEEGKVSTGYDSSTEPKYTMTNLIPLSDYYVCVVAFSSDNMEGHNSCTNVTTPQGEPGSPEDLFGIPISDSEIDLNWSEPPDKNGFLGNYFLQWEVPDVSNTGDSNFTENTNYKLQNLRACGNYLFSVSASTDGDQGHLTGPPASSNQLTLPELPPNITDLTVTNIESRNMTLSWTKPDTLCTIMNYTLEVSGTVLWNDTLDFFNQNIDGEDQTFTVIDLTPWSNYTFCLTPSTEKGVGNESCVTNTTAEDVPSEPTNLTAEVLSASQLYVEWQVPINENGIILQYVVRWESSPAFQESKVVNGFNTTLNDLDECIDYVIRVTAETSVGEGSIAQANATMKSAVPPAPTNLMCKAISSTDVQLNWDAPDTTCEVTGYNVTATGRILWSEGKTSLSISSTTTDITLEDLVPYTEYEIEVFGITDAGGESTTCTVTTEEGAPGPPSHLHVDEKPKVTSLRVLWMVPNVTNGVMKQFNVTWDTGSQNVLYVNESSYEYSLEITNLDSNTNYNISIWGENGYGPGEAAFVENSTKKSPLPLILGILIPVIIIAVLLGIAYANRDRLYYLKNKRGIANPSSGSDHIIAGMSCSVVPIKELKNYVNHLESGSALTREFKSLSAMKPKGLSTSDAEIPFNMKKNRYANILPYNATRVILRNCPSDYINASYVSSYHAEKFFIAAQGPKDDTLEDFWHLIWQERVDVIVMLAACIENGREKCSQYWPQVMESAMHIGPFEIHTINEEGALLFSARIFEVTNKNENVKRIVNHYHYTSWPDFGVPINDNDLLKFLRSVKRNLNENRSNNNMLVHCSAGVGRTGTFIGLWNLIEQVDEGSESVSVMKEVSNMRKQRMTMVQSEEQYLYLCKSIASYCENKNKWQVVHKDSSTNSESLNRRLPQDANRSSSTDLYINQSFEPDLDDTFVGNLI